MVGVGGVVEGEAVEEAGEGWDETREEEDAAEEVGPDVGRSVVEAKVLALLAKQL